MLHKRIRRANGLDQVLSIGNSRRDGKREMPNRVFLLLRRLRGAGCPGCWVSQAAPPSPDKARKSGRFRTPGPLASRNIRVAAGEIGGT